MIDPFTAALAVFGVQKLRGKSTSRAFRDSLLAAGGVQLAGMGGVGQGLGAFQPQAFGDPTSFGSMFAGGNYIGGAEAVNATLGQQLGQTFAGSGIQSLFGDPAKGKIGEEGYKPGTFFGTAATDTTKGTGFRGLGTGEKALLSLTAAPIVSSLFADEPEPVKPPFTEADYQAAYARQPKLSLTEGTGSITRPVSSIYSYQQPNSLYYFNQGGIVSALPRYAQGGINYLPSKVTHDENDVHNYVRATGYVEDGSGNGDKDEDTILAQLADGEFVSRADAVLGAGIMAGAAPGNMKDMRAKGASYFYEQQARFKRIFDLLNASRKVN